MNNINYREMVLDASFGYALQRTIVDETNNPVDYEFIEVNSAFEGLIGLKREQVTGRKLSEIIKYMRDDPSGLIKFYNKVFFESRPAEFEQYSDLLQKWYRVNVKLQGDLHLVTLCYDITEIKNIEKKLNDRTMSLGNSLKEMDIIVHFSLLIQKKGVTLPEVLSDTVNRIPSAFSNHEGITAIIKFRGEVYSSDHFVAVSPWSISENICMRGMSCGSIEVYCRDEEQSASEKQFLNKKRLLIGALARYIEQFAEKIDTELESEQSRLKLAQYMKFAPDGIFIVNRSGSCMVVNPAACSLLGYTEAELLELSIPEITPPESMDESIAAFTDVQKNGFVSMETKLLKKDGTRVCVILESVKLPDGTFMAFCKDITLRKQYQNDLVNTISLNHALIDTIPAPIYYKDNSGKYLGINKAFADFFGSTRENIIGKSVEEITSGEMTRIYAKMDAELMQNPGVQVYEAPLIDFQNRLHDVVFHKAVFFDAAGNPGGLIGVILDITERKKSERELELYFKAIQSVDQPLLISDNKGDIFRVNNAFVRMYGYTLDEVAGKKPSILNPGKDVYMNFGYTDEEYTDLFSSLWKSITDPDIGTWEDVVINRKKDGSFIWVKLLVNTVYDELHQPVNYIALPVDISGTLQRESMTKIQLYQTIASLAELRDNETGNHMRRVGIFAKLLAHEYKMPEKYCNDLEIFAPLHDIGKVGILDSILLAERKLTTEEFEIMKTHTTLGHNIVKGMKELEMVAAITIGHHEWFNGTGYPRGLVGMDIPLSARITSIADVYDALRSKRPYKNEWNHKDSADYVISKSGIQFDPELIVIFSDIIDRFENVYNELKD